MSDLISRVLILKELERIAEIHPYKVIGDRDSYSPYNEAWEDCISLVEERLQFLPSAETEQQKGEWIKEDLSGYLTPGGNSIYHCSECGHTEGPWPWPRLTNFCPSCGADMRGNNEKA